MAHIQVMIGAKTCPDCLGSGKEPVYLHELPLIKEIFNKKPDRFDLDCCRTCRGTRLVPVYNTDIK